MCKKSHWERDRRMLSNEQKRKQRGLLVNTATERDRETDSIVVEILRTSHIEREKADTSRLSLILSLSLSPFDTVSDTPLASGLRVCARVYAKKEEGSFHCGVV